MHQISIYPETQTFYLPPPPATHFVVTGGLIFACVSEDQAKATAAMDANARIFTTEEDARLWLKGATDEIAPNTELIEKVANIFKDDSDKDQANKKPRA